MTIKKLSLLLMFSVLSRPMIGSTYYVFDEKSIKGDAEQQLLRIFKPHEKPTPASPVIAKLIQKKGAQQLTAWVKAEHERQAFKNQAEAKEYATKIRNSAALLVQRLYIETLLNAIFQYVPKNEYFNLQQLKADIITKFENQARNQLKRSGELATFLKGLDNQIKTTLQSKFFSDTCAACEASNQL